MDYEQKYKDALSRARSMYESQDDAELAAYIFPELRESEDERARKEIIEFIRSQIEDGNSVGWDRWIAYLEKQKDVTAVRNVQEAYRKGLYYAIEVVKQNPEKYGLQKEQKPAEWSEEDEKIYNSARDALYYKNCNDKDDVVEALQGLCNLISKHRKAIPVYARWKPSEEQMEALRVTIDFMPDTFKPRCTLMTLQHGLEKLI